MDGASKGNSRPSAVGFCIRNWSGEFLYAAAHDLGVKSSIEADLCVINEGLRVFIQQDWLPVILEGFFSGLQLLIKGFGTALGMLV